jgi:hypothetical protein
MRELLEQIHSAASTYRNFIEAAAKEGSAIDGLGLFGYRISVLESEVIKPLVLALLNQKQPPIPTPQILKALDVIESWMVRRMLVRGTAKGYNQFIAEIIGQLRNWDKAATGDEIEKYLAKQTADSRYWPDDAELLQELADLLAYRRLRRGRLRMLLEAIEDHLRGWRDGKPGLGGERVSRGKLAIEHVMPRKWQQHWPVENSSDEEDRDRLIHTLGNLTLLTGKLNSSVSNGPWSGPNSKKAGLEGHDVLILNRDLLKKAGEAWTEDAIRGRTQELVRFITEIWPVPPDHRSGFAAIRRRPSRKVELGPHQCGSFAPWNALNPKTQEVQPSRRNAAC